ncbi:alpha/beta fold hydrolase [Puerhibacterium puerhi]|uniref:alpha/beta fold hydrolase n=1 Tax=Puerhibacterium puerhi TaxID=2692623 RepID=UPI001357EE4B|nr:alpha/beta fold hydrolase [Puerhibacterium puerhi]
MPTATLHDGAAVDVAVLGDGPAVLLPVGTAVVEGAAAEQARAWGADPNPGRTLATALADAGFRIVAADYEGHLAAHPKPLTLTADAVATDLLAVADAAGVDRFACYGYSWLALAALQLALRTDRLTGLAMGGFPPLGGPYAAMLEVTRATHRMAVAYRQSPPPRREVAPGDWDSVEVTLSPEQTQQYVTLYESLRGFDEAAALDRVTVPRLAFVGERDDIDYGPRWGGVRVVIAGAVRAHRAELEARGWQVAVVPGADHLRAMQPDAVLPVLLPWLRAATATS